MTDDAGSRSPDRATGAPIGAADRVPRSQAQARRSLGLAGAFIVAAAISALIDTGEGRWVPIHLFLAGALVNAIGGASSLFTVTWSAAPAPSPKVMWVQRLLTSVGAAVVVAARVVGWPSGVLWAGAVVFVSGLALLAGVLVVTVRRGVKRRFDTAVAWYVAALAAGVVAAGLGGVYATSPSGIGERSAHVVLNLLGLVGLVIAGTLPSFIATVGRTKMSPRSTDTTLRLLLVVQAGAVAVAALAHLDERPGWAAGALVVYAVGLVALGNLLPWPTSRSLRWAGPRLLALWFGLAWWVVAVLAAARASADGQIPFLDHWTLVLVVVAFGQILWGSLAYLAPVLRGGGHRQLTRGFAALRSWVGLAAVNGAGLAWVAGHDDVARAAVAVWLVDAGVRAVLFSRPGSEPPEPEEPAGAAGGEAG